MNDSLRDGLRVWWDGAADGPTNMAIDELLAGEAVRTGGVLVRIYAWDAPAVSLGAFQSITEARSHEGLVGLPIVRRPSGGGAIVHGSDLTFAVAVPREHRLATLPQRLYDTVHGALVAVLREWGVPAMLSEPAGTEAEDALPLSEKPGTGPLLCFDRRATGDVVIGDSEANPPRDFKVMGSAQRRLPGAVLQHGSLLLASNQAVPASDRHRGLAELCREMGIAPPEPMGLVRDWLRRVGGGVGGGVVEEAGGAFVSAKDAAVVEAARRFREEAWTARR